MGGYVDIDGLQTWYDEEGTGEPLVLLHGGLSTNETWGAQLPAFAARFRVIAPERRAHGHTADVPGPLSYDAMAGDTIGFLDTVVGGPSCLVGWSDGGIVGLLVAIARPDLVRKLVVIGTNYDVDGLVPGAAEMFESVDADSEDMAMFRAMYAQHSPDGPEHWPVVYQKFLEMATQQPHIPLEAVGRIEAPTLVLVGDDDMVSLEHSTALYRAIPGSQLAVVPGASHAVVLEKPELLNGMVLDFLENDPTPTMIPIQRAVHPAEEPDTAEA